MAFGGANKYDHASPILKDLNWLNMENKLKYDVCVFVYKVCNNMLPEWLYSFPTVNEINIRNTRQNRDLFVSRTNTDMGARAVTIRGPSIWNTLPTEVKDSLSILVFKGKLKKILLSI